MAPTNSKYCFFSGNARNVLFTRFMLLYGMPLTLANAEKKYTIQCSMKKALFVLSALFFVAFILFSNLVRKDVFLVQNPLSGVDFNLTVKLQNNVPIRLDPLLKLATDIASAPIFTIILFGALIYLYRAIGSLAIVFMYGSGQLLEFILKNILRQSGPPYLFQRIHTQVTFDKSYQQVGYSYPSGHSFRTVFFALVITYLVARKYGYNSMKTYATALITFGFALTVGLAKVVHGGHWTSDIVGGALLAASCATLSLLFVSIPNKKTLPPKE